jgi:ferredoxin
VTRLWSANRTGGSFALAPEQEEAPRYAFIGVRSCELHAIAHLDDALLHVPHPDPAYAARRERVFVVALNCHQAGGTCFCVSMDTGPRATFGYDLALTEVIEGTGHWFLVEAGGERGAGVLAELDTRPATEADLAAAARAIERAASNQGREMDTTGIKDLLYRNYEHPRWDEVADRCLTCGNCTMVCPTCFCTTVEDVTDLEGGTAERRQQWDSCFTMDFSYVHGGSVRSSGKSRYRQWMTHKLATWIDQFGTSGCVGCGRCITWCPVAIDITEEVAAIRADDRGGPDRLPPERPPR